MLFLLKSKHYHSKKKQINLKIINDYQTKFWFTIICKSNLGCGVLPCQAMRPKGGFCYQKHGLLHDNSTVTLGENKKIKPASFTSWFKK